MDWLLPTTIWLLACVIWIIAYTFIADKKLEASFNLVSSILAFIAIVLLFQKKYYPFAGIVLCATLFIVMFHLGFAISGHKVKPKGPLGNFVDMEGTTVTELTPKGKIRIADQVIEATTEGIFLAEGEKVRVIRSGVKLVVVEKCERQ